MPSRELARKRPAKRAVRAAKERGLRTNAGIAGEIMQAETTHAFRSNLEIAHRHGHLNRIVLSHLEGLVRASKLPGQEKSARLGAIADYRRQTGLR